MDSTGHDETPEVTPPHRRSARNPGARAVVVVLAVVAVVAGAWWVLDAVL